MLAQLSIRNFALVESLSLEFQPGFNVLTGETGAGKSILIDAITAALGERTGTDVVRTGADRALIEVVFQVDPNPDPVVDQWAEEDVVILGREIPVAGRSTLRINGRMATAGAVREVASGLLDIHGQHEHQSLLRSERHVGFLDAWSGPEVLNLRRAAGRTFDRLREVRRILRERDMDAREKAQRMDLLRFQVEEIDAAGIDAEEQHRLLGDRSRLANAERLFTAGTSARAALDSGEQNAVDLLAAAARDVETMVGLDEDAAALAALLQDAVTAARESASELREYLDRLEVNPERLDEVQDRLETYRRLQRKYGDTVAEVLEHRNRAAADLAELDEGDRRQGALEAEVVELVSELSETAASLCQARRAAADRFAAEITGHLADLRMGDAGFSVRLDSPSPPEDGKGLDDVLGRAEFLIAPNAGESARPLARTASGGELSRIMLALKSTMAGSHPVALIFDEIDTGVGGKTAESLGAKMKELSRSNQVLCVTHLPQIAALADRHFRVSKEAGGDRTRVTVTLLEGNDRVAELSRMLGGAESTATVHARQMLASAHSAGSHVALADG